MATPSILLESLPSPYCCHSHTLDITWKPTEPHIYYQSVVMATPSILLESLPSLIHTINLLSWPHPPYYLKAYRASYILSICCHGHTLHITWKPTEPHIYYQSVVMATPSILGQAFVWNAYHGTLAHICSQINHKTARHIAVSLI